MNYTMNNQIKNLERRVLINDLIIIIFMGILFNMSVIIFNDSKMPVYYYNEEGIPEVPNDYISFTNFNEVRYGYLGDIFTIKSLKFSIGDILVFGGIFLVVSIFIHSQYLNHKEKKNGNIINDE